VCLLIIKGITKMLDKIFEKRGVDKGVRGFLKSVVKIFLYFITVLIITDIFGIPTSSLIATLSVVGLAVSLSVQGLLSNLASGVTLLFTKPFSTGDFIDFAGTSGSVKEIGLIYTKLVTPDNKIIVVPNSKISADTLTNYSAEPYRKLIQTYSVSYDSDINKVKELIEGVVLSNPLVAKKEEVFVSVANYAESAIDFTVRAWVDNAAYWDLHFALLAEIKHTFDENGIEIPYNYLNVNVVNK